MTDEQKAAIKSNAAALDRIEKIKKERDAAFHENNQLTAKLTQVTAERDALKDIACISRTIVILLVSALVIAIIMPIISHRTASAESNFIQEQYITAETLPLIVYDPVYPLTDDELWLIECIVMAEAEGESFKGQMAVAQCILNACIKLDKRPAETVGEYQYSTRRPEPSESVRQAVHAVFTDGDVVTAEKITVFYNPARCSSEWHERQVYVCTIGNHKFFVEE